MVSKMNFCFGKTRTESKSTTVPSAADESPDRFLKEPPKRKQLRRPKVSIMPRVDITSPGAAVSDIDHESLCDHHESLGNRPGYLRMISPGGVSTQPLALVRSVESPGFSCSVGQWRYISCEKSPRPVSCIGSTLRSSRAIRPLLPSRVLSGTYTILIPGFSICALLYRCLTNLTFLERSGSTTLHVPR